MNTCPNCQFANKPNARFCQQCGTALAAAAPPPAPADAGNGKTLRLTSTLRGRYQLQGLLAEGGMGAVYRAQDGQLFNRACVVKEMRPYYTNADEEREAQMKFEREAKLLADLNHPAIPQVYDYFVAAGRYYIVMQYVEGQDLERRLAAAGGRLPLETVLDLARQMLAVLTYIGERPTPVLHRDIKPANIILDGSNHAKLVDFGLARAQGGQLAPTTVMGTQGYAPPEQYNGQTEPASDIYALGATLHHLLTGRDPRQHPPFDFPPLRALLPTAPEAVEQMIGRMLARRPADRPTAAQLSAELGQLAQPTGSGGLHSGPFVLRSGAEATTPLELGALLDAHWEDGVFHLYSGHLEVWFQSQNRHDLAARTQQLRARGGDPGAALEELVRTLVPTAALPRLHVAPHVLNLGVVERGGSVTGTLTIRNDGRGYLHGTLRPLVDWVTPVTPSVGCQAGSAQTVALTFGAAALAQGTHQLPVLSVETNGGEQSIVAQLAVTWQPQLGIRPPVLDFGELLVNDRGRPVQAMLTVANTGGGVLTAEVVSPVAWLHIAPNRFQLPSGQSIDVQATADSSQLPALQTQAVQVEIRIAQQSYPVPVRIGIKQAWYSREAHLTRWLGYGAALLGALMLAAFVLAIPALASSSLMPLEFLPFGWLVAAAAGAGGLFYLAQRLQPQVDELEAYYRPDPGGPPPPLTFDSNRRLIALLVLPLLALLLGAARALLWDGTLLGRGLGLGVGMAVLLAGALLLPGGTLAPLRWLLWGGAGALAGSSINVFGDLPQVYPWAVGGLLLGMALTPTLLARRAQTELARLARPLLIFSLTWAAAYMAQMLLLRLFATRADTLINNVFAFVLSAALVVPFGLAGYWLGLPAGSDWRAAPAANRPFSALALLIVLLGSALLWLFGRNGNPPPPWATLLVQTALLGGFVWALYNRAAVVLPLYARAAGWLSGQADRLNAPSLSGYADPNAAFRQLSGPYALALCGLLVGLSALLQMYFWPALVTLVLALAGVVGWSVYKARTVR